MGAIRFIHRGHFEATMNFLGKAKRRTYLKILDKYGRKGVEALSLATPKDSGKTAASWDMRFIILVVVRQLIGLTRTLTKAKT